jgi:Mce-associated membrane protein
MTLPEDPSPATQASDTGWPSETPLPPPPAAPAEPSVQDAPAFGGDEDAPAQEDSTYQEPAYEEPAYAEPTYAEPTYVEPTYAEPTYEEAAYDEPAYQVPTYDEPAFDPEAAYEAPAYENTGEAPAPAPAPATRRSAWRSGPVLALLLTTVLMAVANGFVWYLVRDHQATENARRAGLEASRDAARVLFSYDYRTLAKDFSAGTALTTGRFRSQYADTTSKVVTSVATEKKAVVKADVVTAGIVRASKDTVVTIVYVNQVTTSSLQQGPKVDLSRVRMTLTHVGGSWLVSNVEAL